MIEVKLVDGRFFKQVGLLKTQADAVLPALFQFDVKQVRDGFGTGLVLGTGVLEHLIQMLAHGCEPELFALFTYLFDHRQTSV
jgi:hypothetical protein